MHKRLVAVVDLPRRYLLIGPLPEHGQGEDSGDGGGEVARHRLDVNVQLAAVG